VIVWEHDDPLVAADRVERVVRERALIHHNQSSVGRLRSL
jgi:hypothetical protein